MTKFYFLFIKSTFLSIILFSINACLSQDNNSKKSILKSEKFDSCSIAKVFENAKMTESFIDPDYTGVLNNYMGKDTTKLDFQHHFEHGKLIKSIFYFQNGKVQEVYFYKCSSLNGLQKYYYDNGRLAQVIPYSYGYRQGIGESYYKNGALHEQAIFAGDSLIGEPKSFDETGKLITIEKK